MKRAQLTWQPLAAIGALAVAGFATQAGAVAVVEPGNFSNTEVVLTEPENFSNGDEVPALTNPTTGSIGSGSWQADDSLTGSDGKQHLVFLQGGSPGPYNGGQTSYPQPGKNPQLLFPDGPGSADNVTINDLNAISFDTNSSDQPDWFINLFTRSDDGGFGGPQFDLATDYADNSASANGFTTHAFSNGGGAVYQNSDLSDGGGLTTYSLAELKDSFGDRSLLYIALGTATNYDGLDSLVDNVRFDYSQGDQRFSRTIDLEANAASVPAPSMLPLAGLALALFGWLGLRRRSRG